MTEPASQPTYDKRKFWKLALLCVPACISGVSSYAKSRTEATDQAKATFEHIEKDIDALQADMAKVVEGNYVLKAEIVVLKEQLDATNKHSTSLISGVQPLIVIPAPVALDAGVARPPLAVARPHPRHADAADDADMDGISGVRVNKKSPSFEDIVQSYKSKK